MGRRRLGVLSFISAVVIGSWGFTSVPAFAAPSTTPVISAPLDSSTVGGDVAISATSVAATVQFYVDAIALGTPAVATGTASVQWPTWGLTNSGSHVLTAADCDGSGCNTTQSAGVTVTIDNAAPAVTAPVDGATTGTSLTLEATAPGGGLAFFVDSAQVGFDATSPYSFAVAGPLAEGVHSAFVQECDTTGTACDGPTSPIMSFTVKILHPRITSVSPNPFSPNHDGRSDRTSFRINLSDTENVTSLVNNANGQLVNGPHALGVLGPGNHNYRWDGRTNASRTAGDGIYTIVVTSTQHSGGVTLRGKATASVRVDNTPPTLTGITGNRATFYPVVDGYNDTFRPKVTVNEGGRLWLQIFNRLGTKVRTIASSHAGTGTFESVWNGRNNAGALVSEGRFRYRFVAEDQAGNRRTSASGYVYVSRKRLVSKSVTVARNGEAGHLSTTDQSAPPCTGYSYGLSVFARGVYLANFCDPAVDGLQYVFADYGFAVPGAIHYNSIRVRSYGNTTAAPEPIGALIYNVSTANWDGVGTVSLTHNATNAWSEFGNVSGTHHVSGSHVVKISIVIPNAASPEDYDIGTAQIIVYYQVLR